eukprot:213835_1
MGCLNSTDHNNLTRYILSNDENPKGVLNELDKMFIICKYWKRLFDLHGFIDSLIYIITEYAYTPYLFDETMRNEYDYLFKLVLIGDEKVGKSNIVSCFAENNYSDTYIPTIGVDFKVRTIDIKHKMMMLQIWDTAGQRRFRSITTSYYRGAHGIFFVFDITNKSSFDNILREWKLMVQEHSKKCIKVLIGAKCDLKKERKVSIKSANKLAKMIGCVEYIEVSAKSNINIEYCFTKIVEAIHDFTNFKFDSNTPWMYPCIE